MTREEAIEIVKTQYSHDTVMTTALGMLIPELRESEDEWIPKELIEYLKQKGDYRSCWIAWLEKQKEQKPAEKQNYSGLTDLERAILRGFLCAGIENVPTTIIKETAKECLKLIDNYRPVEWSEEDEVYLADVLWCIEQAEKTAKSENDMGTCWCARRFLKSLKPQPKQDWSEEDEKMIERINSILDFHPSYEKEKKWFNSLNPQTPCPHYTGANCTYVGLKPTDEQMRQLCDAAYLKAKIGDDIYVFPELRSLYYNIQKLTEK